MKEKLLRQAITGVVETEGDVATAVKITNPGQQLCYKPFFLLSYTSFPMVS